MEKKLLKYSNYVNESLANLVASGAKSILNRSKKKIRSLIKTVIKIEQDFIDKSKQLSDKLRPENMLNAPDQRSGIAVSNFFKQQEIMVKRALESITEAKELHIKDIQKKILSIIGDDKVLAEFYNSEIDKADDIIAEYSHEVLGGNSDKFADTEYEKFGGLSDLRKSLDSIKDNTENKHQLEDITKIGDFVLEKPFNLKWEFFIDLVNKRPLNDLIRWKHEGGVAKWRGQEEYKRQFKELKDRKKDLDRNKNENPNYLIELEAIEKDNIRIQNMDMNFSSMMKQKLEYLQKIANKIQYK